MNIAVKALFQYKSGTDANLIVGQEFFNLCIKECKGATAVRHPPGRLLYIVHDSHGRAIFVRVGDVRVFTAKTAHYCGVPPNEHSR